MTYEVPEPEYLERQIRMLDARGVTSGTIDPAAIERVLAEVAPLELIPGDRYRVLVLGGVPTMRHVHGFDPATGREVALDLPDVDPADAAWVTIEATYVGRGVVPGFAASLAFRMAGDELAVLADIDVRRLEKLA